jgi:para-aminobenzoate synthetase component 1
MLYSTPLPYQVDACTYFAAIRDLPWAAWLDSGGKGRFDILVAQPVATLTTQGEYTEVGNSIGVVRSTDDPFELIRKQVGEHIAPMSDIPFAGGALGYWGYDLARRYHRIPDLAQGAGHSPEMVVGIYDWAIVLDHQKLSARLVSRLRCAETAQVLPKILARLERADSTGSRVDPSFFRVQGKIESNKSFDTYRNAFETVKQYLFDGDCYQVNLAQCFSARASGDAYAAYLELRRLSPAPYAAFLDWPQTKILCASPERFLQVQQGRVETKPIKGTRARNADPAKDMQLATDLARHPKDRAENLMIVDLLRNDLGKSCEPGSVRVPKLFEVESFTNVHHLVSTVEGKLKSGWDSIDVLRDCFPGGSITGAPKQRAMEIIEQLEPNRRGVYCGAIGYVGFDGNMDSNVAIRTLEYAGNQIRFCVGGGIVADSQCEAEYQETLDKAAAMLALLQLFGGKLD